jgi:hypothetical protein
MIVPREGSAGQQKVRNSLPPAFGGEVVSQRRGQRGTMGKRQTLLIGAKPMAPPPGKLRTRAHVLADLSINYVERQVLLCGFSVDRVQHDYGYDLTMTSYQTTGEIEPGPVYIQVKATDHLPWLADEQTISWLVNRLHPRAVRAIASHKNVVHKQLRGKGGQHA